MSKVFSNLTLNNLGANKVVYANSSKKLKSTTVDYTDFQNYGTRITACEAFDTRIDTLETDYLQIDDAASTYQTQTGMSSYLTTTNAALAYLALTGGLITNTAVDTSKVLDVYNNTDSFTGNLLTLRKGITTDDKFNVDYNGNTLSKGHFENTNVIIDNDGTVSSSNTKRYFGIYALLNKTNLSTTISDTTNSFIIPISSYAVFHNPYGTSLFNVVNDNLHFVQPGSYIVSVQLNISTTVIGMYQLGMTFNTSEISGAQNQISQAVTSKCLNNNDPINFNWKFLTTNNTNPRYIALVLNHDTSTNAITSTITVEITRYK